MMACFRANPLEPLTLKDIYMKVASERNIHGDLQNNEMSLRITSEAIIDLLEKINPEALTFYYFLGMLPVGALPDQLL